MGSPPDNLGGFFSMVNRFPDYVNSFMHTAHLISGRKDEKDA
jgi:hypothetical protein